MGRKTAWMTVIALTACLSASACGADESDEAAGHEEPAKVEVVEGTKLKAVTLTARAAERLDVQTAAVRRHRDAADEPRGDGARAIPYSAVLYDVDGETFTYTEPQRLVYVRAPITIDSITHDVAVLSDGPPVGTQVVTVGAAELYGAEVGVGH